MEFWQRLNCLLHNKDVFENVTKCEFSLSKCDQMWLNVGQTGQEIGWNNSLEETGSNKNIKVSARYDCKLIALEIESVKIY